jgi:hypothetical protein
VDFDYIFAAERKFGAQFWQGRREVLKGVVGFCPKETPAIKVVVVFQTFGIIVQFLFLLAGAR